MRKLINEIFYIPNHSKGKMREKAFFARITVSVLMMVFCLSAMGITAYAWFTGGISSASNKITSASYVLDWEITVEASAEGETDQKSVFENKAEVVLSPDITPQSYVITITRGTNCTASTGFCVMKVDYRDEAKPDETYHTVQIGTDGNTERDSYTFYVTVNQEANITLSQHWGTSSYYDDFADNPLYLGVDKTTKENPLILGTYASQMETTYYGSLSDALSGTAGSSDPNGADVAVEKIDNKVFIKLLQDIELTQMLSLDSNITLDLNGHKITSNIPKAISVNANVILSGAVSGSGITAVASDNNEANLFDVISGSLQINGGTYSVTTKNAGTAKNQAEVFHVAKGANLNMNGAVVTATNTENGSVVGVLADEGSVVDLTNTKITVSSGLGLENVGVYSKGDVKISNCEIVAKSDYTANEAGTDYASHSRGVYCEGKLEMYDSYVWGSHSGVTAKGDVYVDGGTYEGYGHGGIYFSGNDSTSYIYNAAINWAEMKEGTYADTGAGTNEAGMYVGSASNMTVTMDNCNIYGTFYGIVLRNSSGENNNKVYVSNSEFTGCSRCAFRIRSGKNTAFSGVGNVYPGNTNDSTLGNFIETTDSYAREEN